MSDNNIDASGYINFRDSGDSDAERMKFDVSTGLMDIYPEVNGTINGGSGYKARNTWNAYVVMNVNNTGQAQVVSSSAMRIMTGNNQSMGLSCGGSFIWSDRDASEALRMSLDSATGDLDVTGTVTAAKTAVEGEFEFGSLSADPDDPAEGKCVMWISDGTGSGNAGDLMIKLTMSSTTYTKKINVQ